MFTYIIRSVVLCLIYLYRYIMSPLFINCCRYQPTCSIYTIEVIREYGLFLGSYLAIKRLLNCHPWGNFGFDPAPIFITHIYRFKEKSIKWTSIFFLICHQSQLPKHYTIKMSSVIIATTISLAIMLLFHFLTEEVH
ncbi:membrane protein insertion efficiency factor YidD [Candidatus Endolissoclinum faulkneri]|uniref:membrane protein insertion efficiency factor YidD n=1 Tax=Candidatus Endolissoclinum faulkneri TaxID=1263979 RepID=UPI0009DB5200